MNRFLSQSSRLVLTRSTRGLVGSALRNGNFPPSSMAKASGVYISRRYNSSEAGKDAAEKAVENFPSGFDVSNVADSAVIDAATAIAVEAPAKAGFVVDHIMSGIDLLHTFAGIPYWEAIVLTTIGVRICLLPVALKTVQGAARMACVRPDLKKIQDKMKADPNSGDMQAQMRYQQEMKAIMKKHDVNPFRAMLWPFAQFPIFIAFFWALQDMGTFYPGFATGGALWFTNLAAPDALLILPVLNSLSFWAMIELGSDGVQMEQASTFKNVMRGLAVVMVPLTMNMPQVMFERYFGFYCPIIIFRCLFTHARNWQLFLSLAFYFFLFF